MKALLASTALAILSLCAPAHAQGVPEPKQMLIRGGVMCDTEVELQTLLTGISLNNGQFPEKSVEGCGRFVPEQPIPMLVTPLYWYDTVMVNTLVASFTFEPNGWTQYGWIAYVPNPEWKPEPESDPA